MDADRRVVGIDLGIRKAAYALWDADGRDNHSELIQTGMREARPQHRALELEVIAEWAHETVYEIALAGHTYVFIEEPLLGNNRKYSLNLAMTFGAVLSELADLHNAERITIFGVNVQSWKKGTVGKGNAGKEEVRNYILGINSSYPALCGHDQDRIDAACIGLFGVRTAARADQLQDPSQYQLL